MIAVARLTATDTVKSAIMNSKHLSYWRCQLGGWGLAALSNFLLQIKRPGHHLEQELIANLSMMLAGIAATHLLRALYHRYGLLQRSLWAILAPIIALSVAATVLMVTSLLGLLYVFKVFEQADILQPDNILANLVGLFPLILIWNTLYLSIHSFQRWRQSELDKAALATALKDAQINALMGQLNPHFIFNALTLLSHKFS